MSQWLPQRERERIRQDRLNALWAALVLILIWVLYHVAGAPINTDRVDVSDLRGAARAAAMRSLSDD